MTRRTLINLVLGVIVLGLAAVIWKQPGLHPPDPVPLFTQTTAAAVQTIRITRRNGESVQMRRQNQGWQLSVPFTAPVNQARIENILNILQVTSLGRFSPQQLQPATVQLEPPLLILQLDALEIRFGGTEPLDRRRYIQVDDEIHLIRDDFFYQLDTPATGFVDHHLLPPAFSIQHFRSDALELRRQDGRWQVLSGPDAVSADAIQEFVTAWKEVQALSVQRYTARDDTSQIQIGSESHELTFSQAQQGETLILGRPDLGIEYHLPMHLATPLLELRQEPVMEPGKAN